MKKVVLFIVVIGYLILHCSIVAAAGEDIPRPELVRLANEELIRKGLHDGPIILVTKKSWWKGFIHQPASGRYEKLNSIWGSPRNFFTGPLPLLRLYHGQ